MVPLPPDDATDGPEDSPESLQRRTRIVPVSTGRATREIPTSEEGDIPPEGGHDDLGGIGDIDVADLIRDGKLIARTEDLADRALDRLKSEVGLPNVLEEAEGIARTVRAIRSRALAATVAMYVITASVGVAATAAEGIHDWFMHVAMYVVILSFVIIYVKAHLLQRAIARSIYALVSAGLMFFFAWVLNDLIPSRMVVIDGDAVERAEAQLLLIPSVMLVIAALGLLVHWLVLARHDARR